MPNLVRRQHRPAIVFAVRALVCVPRIARDKAKVDLRFIEVWAPVLAEVAVILLNILQKIFIATGYVRSWFVVWHYFEYRDLTCLTGRRLS